jgi:HAD superfamily hydrolase (TIGR01509 family)
MASQFFEGIFFDMDGLTINSEPQWLEAETELTAPYGYIWTTEDQAACLGGPLWRVGQYMSEKCNSVKDGKYFHEQIVELMAKKVRHFADFMPGAKVLLEELNKSEVPLALVSASPRIIVDAALSHVQPIPFQITISADDVKETKPNPEGYLKVAELLNVKIENCLIFEDSATGVKAARASGAKVIAVPHLVKINEDAQTKIFSSLEELNLSVLKTLYKNW